jgi:predicted ATPase/DNA-binding winged helix-turn-helix (wHTH) protein
MREAISFGPFRLFPAERLVEKNGVPIHIGGRSLDILICLAEGAGEVISKRDLVARVWADIHVEEGSLRFHVAALRKALGDGRDGARYVANTPGRGYSLVSAVSRSTVAEDVGATTTASMSRSHTLPQRVPNMIGRDETVEKLIEELSNRRIVTVVGPGGIGKTTVVIAVGHAMLSRFDGAVYFLDLSAVSDGRLVPDAIASMLGLLVQQENSLPGLLTLLKDQRILLILDSCERIVDTIAGLVEEIFEKAPQVHVLATSRESLRADREYVHRLFPLKCPPQGRAHDLAEMLAYPAAKLFFERAVASGLDFTPSNSDIAGITDICAKLDGIPLAIELAASRVAAYGIQGVASLLDTRFGLLWQGRRTALPRHQTLSATLDWSYDLLPEFEQVILRRLAIFVGFFTLDAARAVVAGDGVNEEQVVEAIADLVDKSMLNPAIDAGTARYRLLDMTHAYLLGKPIAPDVAASLARRHALFYCRYLDQTGSLNSPAEDPGAPLRHCLGNVRAALEWCFSLGGDRAAGIDLVAASAQYFLEMSLLTECQHWVGQAITASVTAPTSASRELALQYAMGISLMFTSGDTEEVPVAFNKGLKIANALNDLHSQLRLLSALHIFKTRVSDFIGALELSERCIAVAKRLGDPASITMAEWMAGTANHLLGNQAQACVQSESAMTWTLAREWGSVGQLGYDRRIIALVVRARALWLVGRPEQAAEVAKYTVKEALKLDNPWTFCVSLVYSTTVFIWSGDWAHAEENIERLLAYSVKHSLKPYHAVGLGLKGDLTLRVGAPAAGIRLLRDSLESASRIQFLATVFMGTLAEGLMMTGQPDEAMIAIEASIAQLGDARASFAYPELLRIKGEVQRSLNQPATVVEACLLQSLEHARKQSSLGWELRAAMNLAQLWSDGNRCADALALLRAVYGRFTEGFETSDLKAAQLLLQKLETPPRHTRAGD